MCSNFDFTRASAVTRDICARVLSSLQDYRLSGFSNTTHTPFSKVLTSLCTAQKLTWFQLRGTSSRRCVGHPRTVTRSLFAEGCVLNFSDLCESKCRYSIFGFFPPLVRNDAPNFDLP